MPTSTEPDAWPPLPYAEWRETYAALHLWTQIVGKVRLARTPWLNHSWQSPLYVTARGLTTGVIPHGARALALEFDFVDHALRITTDVGMQAFPLEPMSVADFYRQLTRALSDLGVPVRIHAAYAGVLAGPPVLGFVAHAVGLPAAFWFLAGLLLLVPLLARTTTA
jgi:hypothetical protein